MKAPIIKVFPRETDRFYRLSMKREAAGRRPAACAITVRRVGDYALSRLFRAESAVSCRTISVVLSAVKNRLNYS